MKIFRTSQIHTEETYARKTYFQIILLALAAHLSFIVIFAFLSFWELCIYNIISVCFYIAMSQIVKHGFYRVAVSLVHLEVCIFVSVTYPVSYTHLCSRGTPIKIGVIIIFHTTIITVHTATPTARATTAFFLVLLRL